MGLKDFFRAICCCGAYNKTKEKEPLLRNNHSGTTYSAESVALRDDEWNLWGTPHDSSHIESDDDRELYSLIVTRNQLQHNTEEWEKLNYDIHTLRQTHREVRGRWRKILEKLGFLRDAPLPPALEAASHLNRGQHQIGQGTLYHFLSGPSSAKTYSLAPGSDSAG
ncbi:Melanoregulin [Acipenser ruthenus]|uniref:Melanoregulin n=1 Tax=Acipenser ruthenus TaxID=7906 RepID=A0A662YU12_ACIRT|nr:Melanoregulin [Acipenser ruthenus]